MVRFCAWPRLSTSTTLSGTGGTTLSSTSYQISLDSLGESVLGNGLSSPSFSMDGGLLPAYRPAG